MTDAIDGTLQAGGPARRRLPPADGLCVAVFIAGWVGLVVVPLVGILLYTIFRADQFTLTAQVGLSQFADLAASGRLEVILRTLWIAGIVTAIDLVIALPFAYWLAKLVTSVGTRTLLLTAAVVPFFLSVASRTIVWRPILSSNGLLNTLLVESGLVQEPVGILLFSEPSVIGGLALTYFPSMLFPIFLAVSLIDDDYIAAASDLGAGPLQLARTVVLPLALPGILGGIIFTFVPVLGEAVIPQLLGGGRVNMLSRSVMSALQAVNLNVAATMCTIIFLCLGLLLLALYASIRLAGGLPQFGRERS